MSFSSFRLWMLTALLLVCSATPTHSEAAAPPTTTTIVTPPSAHHLCDCIESKSTPLSSCFSLQALTRNESHLTLIESEQLYWIPVSENARESLSVIHEDGARIPPAGKWYEVPSLMSPQLRAILKEAHALVDDGYGHYTLYYYGQIHRPGNFTGPKRAQDILLSGGHPLPVRATIWDGEAQKDTVKLGFPLDDMNKHFSTLVSGGRDYRGYCVEMPMSSPRLLFYDFQLGLEWLERGLKTGKPGVKPTAFLLKPVNESHARFIPASSAFLTSNGNSNNGGRVSDIGKDLLYNLPLGYIQDGRAILLDAATDTVYVLPYLELQPGYPNDPGRATEPFPVKQYRLRNFIHCRKAQDTDAQVHAAPENIVRLDLSERTLWVMGGSALLVLLVAGGCGCYCCFCGDGKRRRGRGSSRARNQILGGGERSYKYQPPPSAGTTTSSKFNANRGSKRPSNGSKSGDGESSSQSYKFVSKSSTDYPSTKSSRRGGKGFKNQKSTSIHRKNGNNNRNKKAAAPKGAKKLGHKKK